MTKPPYPPCSGATAPVEVSVVVTRFRGASILAAVAGETFPANRLLETKSLTAAVVTAGGMSSLCVVYRLISPFERKSGGITRYS
jgi:hypothetical protein